MRTATFTLLLFVAFVSATSAQQFSVLPQLGFENSTTKIRLNDLPSFVPAGAQISPQLGIRMDYKFKHGHGPFLGIATSRSVVSFNFSDPETARTIYKASAGNLQLRLEGGYLFSTKPIYLSKSSAVSKSNPAKSVKTVTEKYTTKKTCGEYKAKSQCGSERNIAKNHCGSNSKRLVALASKAKNNSWWVRIQPSAGMALIPSVKPDFVTKTQGSVTSYEYRAGNWNTALVTGTAFEFGKSNQRKFTLSLNYIKGLGNLDRTTITTVSGAKTTTTTFNPSVSSWNFTAGIPISLNKKPVMKPKTVEKIIIQRSVKKTKTYEGKCGQYKAKYKRVI